MPTRSIRLKLIVPRDDGASARALRQAIWTTHAFVNGAVAYYEEILLELRQEDVCIGRGEGGQDVIVTGAEYRKRLRARLAQKGLTPPRIEAALPLLHELYRAMVKSHDKAGSGSGQDGRSYHSLLVDPVSASGVAKRAKTLVLQPLAPYVDDPIQFEQEARDLVARHADMLLRSTGAPNAWVLAYRKAPEGPDWLERLRKYVAGLVADDAFAEALDERLRRAGVAPLCAPYGEGRVQPPVRGCLSAFERSALEMAVEHLNQWESWGHLARKQKADREARRDQMATHIEAGASDALAAVRRWEGAREAHLRTLGELGALARYRLRLRELRGWRDLRAWLARHTDADSRTRAEAVKDLQRRDPRGFGGEAALAWLAEPAQRWLVDHPAGDVISQIAALNVAEDVCERTRSLPTFTRADPFRHPRFVKLGKPGDDNSPGYTLVVGPNGSIGVRVEVLRMSDSGSQLLEQEEVLLPLAPSGQLHGLHLVPKEERADGLGVRWRSQDGLGEVQGVLQGATLLLLRRTLEHRSPAQLADGALGAVWLKLAFEVGGEQADDLKVRARVRQHLSSAAMNRAGKGSPPPDGFRILAVDLGLRAAATVSRFTIGKVPGREPWPTDPRASLVLVHERSSSLGLPGEAPDARSESIRQERDAAVRCLRAGLTHLRQARRVCVAGTAEARLEALEALSSPPRRGTEPSIRVTAEEVGLLRVQVAADDDSWRAISWRVFDRLERDLGEALGQWRRTTRSRADTRAAGGKSAWTVEHLDRCYRLLRAWGRHQRPQDPSVRRPVTNHAARLRDHIDAVRKDRVKTTADLITQAARGLAYRDGAWIREAAPVDLIVLEDLERYRFKTDRPRFENSQLMRWSHRKILEEVTMQAEVEGIPVATTGASFSSRFDARTGAPGVRCHPVTAADTAALQRGDGDYWLVHLLTGKLADLRIDLATLRPGDLVPTGSGKLLVTVCQGSGIRILDADINAAQGLARRYVEGHVVPFRVAATMVTLPDGRMVALADVTGAKRLRGALGGPLVVFMPLSDTLHPLWSLESYANKGQVARALGFTRSTLVGRAEIEDEHEGTATGDREQDDMDEAAGVFEATRRERLVFFCDPSGTITGSGWQESKVFWGRVRSEVTRRLRVAGRLPAPMGR